MTTNLFPLPYWAPALQRVPLSFLLCEEISMAEGTPIMSPALKGERITSAAFQLSGRIVSGAGRQLAKPLRP
ncbi:MAG: hypothetical protein WBE04_09350 [Methyloceanibacter sp.]